MPRDLKTNRVRVELMGNSPKLSNNSTLTLIVGLELGGKVDNVKSMNAKT